MYLRDSAYIPHMVSARFTASLQHSPVYSHHHPDLGCGWEAGCLSWGGGDLHLHCDSRNCYHFGLLLRSLWVLLCGFDLLHPRPDEWQLSCSDTSSPILCTDLDYQATLTSVGTVDMNGAADLTSTFRFTATAELNGTVVQCSAVTATTTPPATQTLITVG